MNDLSMILKGIAPTGQEAMVGGVGSLAGLMLTHLYGGWSNQLEFLIIAMIIDYISGVAAAYNNPDMTLDSEIGARGIVKKVIILLMVAMGHIVDETTGMQAVMPMILYFYLANECLSITENAANVGLPVPQKLKQTLRQVRSGKGGHK